jgi:very-short-patch-repair endonuclease
MISFSSKYFYSNNLQPMKILNKPISDVISFKEIKMDKLDVTENTNSYECEYIISQLEELILKDDPPSVAVITPFTNQQQFISSQIYNHPKIDDFKEKLKIRIFTFDTCQGEERDTIFYSMVASVDQDKLMYIFPKSIQSEFADEDEIERNKKLQRLNVGFSRAKEKIVFVLSKPLFDFKGSIGEALRHFHTVFEKSKELPTEKDTDQKSKMEAKLLNWIKQTSIIHELGDTCRLSTQFKIGDYLKTIDPNYTNPRYEVDFLLKVKSLTRDEYHNIIIEYDGLREHFTNLDEVDSSNFEYYLREEDVERQKVLESYGYHMIRVNKFNLGSDEVETIDSRIRKLIKQLENKVTNSFLDNLKKKSKIAEDGLTDGSVKQCNKCGEYLNKEEYFRDEKLKSKYGIVCKNCKVPRKPFYGKSYRGNRYRRRY